MQDFLSAGPYTEPVDIKKLRFVHQALESHAAREGKQPRELSVLEIACGVGGITLPVAALGCRVRAIDIDETDVNELRREARSRGYDNLSATVDDALAFDEGGRYDVVIASELFEHILDPERLMTVVRRYTAPGGIFILTTPNGYGPWEASRAINPYGWVRRWNWLRRKVGREPYAAGGGRDHCQRFSRRRLVGLCAAQSFRLIGFANSDFVFTIFRHLRRNRFFGGLDTRMADALPHWMASGWYMVFQSDNDS